MKDLIFQIPEGDNRTPVEIAYDWLLALELKPGDVITIEDFERAMCLIDPDTLPPGRRPLTAWSLGKMSVQQAVIERYEETTGEILMTVGRGRLLVVPHEEVAEKIYEPAYATVLKTFSKALQRIANASKDDITSEELERRNKAVSKISDMRSFMSRRNRKKLAD